MNKEGLKNSESLQIVSRLCNVINDENYYSSNYKIVKYILTNIYKIKNTNIYEIADNTNTSRSTIRRFCIMMGYDNFYKFKSTFVEDFDGRFIDNDKKIVQNYKSDKALICDYKERINDIYKVITNLINSEMMEKISSLADIIHSSKDIAILSSGYQLDKLKEFQTEMARLGKVIHLIPYNQNNIDTLKNMKPSDSIIVISWTGKFSEFVEREIQNLQSRKYLITLEENINFDEYNEVFIIDEFYFEGIEDNKLYKNGLNYRVYICLHYIIDFITKVIQDKFIQKEGKDV